MTLYHSDVYHGSPNMKFWGVHYLIIDIYPLSMARRLINYSLFFEWWYSSVPGHWYWKSNGIKKWMINAREAMLRIYCNSPSRDDKQQLGVWLRCCWSILESCWSYDRLCGNKIVAYDRYHFIFVRFELSYFHH